MGVEIVDVSEGLLTIKITGKLKRSELDRAQQSAIEIIQKQGKVRFLVIAEDFQGWDNRGDWDDLSFQMQYDEYIEKIAIVGEKKWEDLAFAFVGKGLRPVTIEYFIPPDLGRARAWVTEKHSSTSSESSRWW
jgi:hypothetical protein